MVHVEGIAKAVIVEREGGNGRLHGNPISLSSLHAVIRFLVK
jgi:hypothetical protein